MLDHYYNALGLKLGADKTAIKTAYRQKVKQFHPDINHAPDAHERFVEVQVAYDVLMNGRKRTRGRRSDSFSEKEKEIRKNAKYKAYMRYEEFKKKSDAFMSPFQVKVHTLAVNCLFTFGLCIALVVVSPLILYIIGALSPQGKYDYPGMSSMIVLIPLWCFGLPLYIWKLIEWRKELKVELDTHSN